MDIQLLCRNSLVVLFILGFYLFIAKTQDEKGYIRKWHLIGCLAFSFLVTAIVTITGVTPLSGFHTDLRLGDINWNPITGIAELFELTPMFGVVNVFGNIILFMPIGFFLPLLCRKNQRFARTVLYGFLFSLLIEIWQLFLCRGTDIVDLMTNTLGTAAGYGCYLLFCKWFPAFSACFYNKNKKAKRTEQLQIAIAIFLPVLVTILLGFIDRVNYGIV